MGVELEFDPVYPCRFCKENRPMRYVPELSHGTMPEGLDIVQCYVCEMTMVRDIEDRLVMKQAILKAWSALVDIPVDNIPDDSNPVDDTP